MTRGPPSGSGVARSTSNITTLSPRSSRCPVVPMPTTYAFDSAFITSIGQLCPFGLVTCNYSNSSRGTWGGLELKTTWDWLGTGELVSTLGAEVRGRLIKTSSKASNADDWRRRVPRAARPRCAGHHRGHVPAADLAGQRQAVLQRRGAHGSRSAIPAGADPPHRRELGWLAWRDGEGGLRRGVPSPELGRDQQRHRSSHRRRSLAPEREQSGEGSVQQQIGSHRILAGVFYTHWTNLVELRTLSEAETIQAIRDGRTSVPFTPGVQLTQYRNAASIRNYGINAGIDGALGIDRFQYGLTVTAAVAERVDGGSAQRLAVAPQLFGNARLAYVLGGNLPTVALAAQFLGRRIADHAADGGFVPTPSAPIQAQLRLCVSGAVPGLAGLTYRALANYAYLGSRPVRGRSGHERAAHAAIGAAQPDRSLQDHRRPAIRLLNHPPAQLERKPMSNKREPTMKRIGIGTIVTASVFTLGACSDGGTTTQTGNICTSLPPLAMKSTYRVGFSQLYEANGPWRNANTQSVMDEAAKRGYEIVYHAGTKPDAAEQAARM